MFGDEEDLDYLEGRRSTIWMVVGGTVLLLVILVLCLMIWRLYHEDPDGENGLGQQYAEGSESREEPGNSVGSEGLEAGNEDSENLEGSGDGSGNSGESGGMQGVSGAGEAGGDETDGGNESSPEGGTNGGNANLPEEEGAGGNESFPEGGNAGEASNTETPSADTPSIDMSFQDVDEIVTAKEITNLRNVPSTATPDTVVAQLSNGQTAHRTGINEDTGWSRLEYEGQVLYASSRLLTTDLTAKPPQEDNAGENERTDDNTVITAGGRKIFFTPCDDTVSPKIEVNLRTEPATDQGDATVHCLLKYGKTVHRTGFDEASGWSRVEYEGMVLYAVTSYLYVVEPETEAAE